MTEYRVTWAIDTDEDDPLSAARYALQVIQDADSIAHVFTVTKSETGERWQIDLDYQDPDVGPQELIEQIPRAPLDPGHHGENTLIVSVTGDPQMVNPGEEE